MPPREQFPTEGLDGAPSEDIGWYFGTPEPGNRNNVRYKLCIVVIKGGITRLEQHIAHMKGQVAACGRVTIMFRRETRASENAYEHGGSSRVNVSGTGRLEDISFYLRSANIDLVRRQSMKQPRAGKGFLKTWRKRLGEAVSKFIIYERLPMNLSNSHWLHNFIYTASEVGKAKCPTPYEISNVYLVAEYKEMLEWINSMKKTWQERGATIMCDGWTDSINHTHIMNFLVYCHKGTVFWKSVDASDVDSRNTDYYFQLLDKVMEEVGEEYVVQVVTDNEAALKAVGQKLMEKRPHLYWSSCATHCLYLCLEDIGKKKSIHNLLSKAKMGTTFIYNHTYIVSLMKKYTGGRDIVRPGVTRFATQFLQLQAIVRQKEGLENMFNSEEFRKTKYVNGDEKPTMGFIYESIDRSKQAIQQNSRYHSKYSDIIYKRWKFMHSDLHSVGYFLNPQFQCGIEHGKVVYKETFNGTTNVIMKIERNMDAQIKALNQLRMRDKLRKSHEEIEANFDPINIDYIFQEDLLSHWIEERENLLLDAVQNAEWLPIVDTDDENVDDNSETNESGGGLSPPSSNSGDGGGNEVDNEGEGEGGSGGGDDEGEDDELDPYHETPPNYRRYRNLTNMDRSDNLLIETRGNVSQSGRKGKRKQNVPLEDSSSSSISHSFSDFGIGDSSQSSQQSYPPVYQYSYFNPYNKYPSDQAPPYYQRSMNYHNPYHQQSSNDFFGYVFGRRATQDDSQGENTSYAPSCHSTMW
ncbi:hypothetical protein KIW84_033901 [Lathyrus oleraceus]|uniref:DUF659 domain-containing protein n=1 Tax=Pisum sativum TaxID=3888 RepID=A0A9D5B3S5_PEA|nr:hypothetical protein KIW84_033901 [Pisum sativum]